MKQLTAILTAAAILFSLSVAAWGAGEEIPSTPDVQTELSVDAEQTDMTEPEPDVQTGSPAEEAPLDAVETLKDIQTELPGETDLPTVVIESEPNVQTESSGDPGQLDVTETEQNVQAEFPTEEAPSDMFSAPVLQSSPDEPDVGYINPEGSTVSENSNGVVMNRNDGTVNTNRGTVEINNGTVNVNAYTGTVITNNGTAETNGGTVEINHGTVETNGETVEDDNGTVVSWSGTVVQNSSDGLVHVNNSIVTSNAGNVGSNTGTVETNVGTVSVNEFDGTVEINNGTVDTNYGTVFTNEGTVSENNVDGTVKENKGIVVINQAMIETNLATVETNINAVNDNAGTIEKNNGLVDSNHGIVEMNNNSAHVYRNDGTVVVNDGTVSNCGGTVTFNAGDVQYEVTPEAVKYNAGEVFLESFNGEKFDRTSYFGVVYANEDGEGRLLPQALTEQLLQDPANAESILAGLVNSGDLVFTAAESDTADPEKNGVIILLSEADLSFEKSGFMLSGWLDARHNNTAYALGETVTVTAPLWLIPNWVLIPITLTEPESETVTETGPQTQENGTFYLLAPAAQQAQENGAVVLPAPPAAAHNESWNFSNVTLSSSDPRVTDDAQLPVGALRLSTDLAEILRIWPMRVEFDGEVLPGGSYSLSFHHDGTVTLLFSRTFLSTLGVGEHEIILCLHDTEIDVTMLLTAQEKETSLRDRKAQLSGAFTNMPTSSAGSMKGKSG